MYLKITEVIMNREKYYPYSMICPVCGAKLKFQKDIRTISCNFCSFHDVAINAKEVMIT